MQKYLINIRLYQLGHLKLTPEDMRFAYSLALADALTSFDFRSMFPIFHNLAIRRWSSMLSDYDHLFMGGGRSELVALRLLLTACGGL